MKAQLWQVLLIVFLVGCAAPVPIVDYRMPPPAPDKRIDHIKQRKNGTVEVGMSPERVTAELGKPWTVNASGDVGGSFDQWVYLGALGQDDLYLYFRDGKLVRWQELR